VERGSRRSKHRTPGRVSTPSLGAIEALIADHGSITIGEVPPAGCVAAAADQNCCYAMLRRRKGEDVLSLLIRLDKAIVQAVENDTIIDEVNPPGGFPVPRP
jgi:hypothetical protein